MFRLFEWLPDLANGQIRWEPSSQALPMSTVRRVHPSSYTRVLFVAVSSLVCAGLLFQVIGSQGNTPDVKLVAQLFNAYRQMAEILLGGGLLLALAGLVLMSYGERITLNSRGIILSTLLGPLVVGESQWGWGDYPMVKSRRQKSFLWVPNLGGLGTRFPTLPEGPGSRVVLVHSGQNQRHDIPLALVSTQGPTLDAALAQWSKVLSRPYTPNA